MADPFVIFVVREPVVILYAQEKVTWGNLVGFAAHNSVFLTPEERYNREKFRGREES